MKIRVEVRSKANSGADATLDLIVRPSETAASVKERVAGVQLIPFPEQELSLDGVVLADESKLSTCGIEEGSSLSLEIKATEATLAQQLTELLKARDLSSDELGLLYCYKHGASINQALKFLGFELTLQDFVNKQKSLSMENGSVTIVRTDTTLKPFSVVEEVAQILKASDSDSMEIKDLCAKFVQKFGVNLSSIVGTRPGEFLAKETATFTLHGRHGSRVSLQGERKQKKDVPSMSATSSDSEAINAPQGLSDATAPGLVGEAVPPPPGLGGEAAPPCLGGEAAPPGLGGKEVAGAQEYPSVYNQQFEELHSTILRGSTEVMQRVNTLVGALSDASFLDIHHVVIGGSVGKGTTISGLATAEAVLFLQGLPVIGHDNWYAPLLKAFAGSFADAEDFQNEHGIDSACIQEDYIKIVMDKPSPIIVHLYLSPVFGSYQNAIQVLGEQAPDAQKFYAPSLAKERTQFVSRQPSAVKMTIRLILWWRDQQQWYGRLSLPSNELLELAAIYSSIRTKPADQQEAIANLMSLLSHFDELRVVWSNYYSKSDVPGHLLSQKPLLLDPANPLVNVADPQNFDATELMMLARTTHFFW